MGGLVLASFLAIGSLGLGGCRVTDDDLHRWESKQHGPEKLEAVLFFPKYDTALRVQAALSLIHMKPRGYLDPFDAAQNQDGIEGMVKTLAKVPEDQRAPIVASIVPALVVELAKKPPDAQADQKAPPDPSYPYKDAAYAMFVYDKATLIADEGLHASLKDALIKWAMADFESRLENRSQKYGMEQLLRLLGSDSVVELPKHMTRDARNLDKMASLVAELGNEATKEEASKALAEIAKFTISDDWVKVKTPIAQEANKRGGVKFDADPKIAAAQFKAQLDSYQDQDVERVFASMKKVGGRASIDFALTVAGDKNQKMERRQVALASLENHLDLTHPEDINKIFAIAKSDSPNEVLDQAFRRISELPKDKVLDRMYEIVQNGENRWKVRRAAAVVVLKMLTLKDLDSFMGKLPDKDNSKGYSKLEAIGIAANMVDLKVTADAKTPADPKLIRDAIKKYLNQGNPAERATAASYFLNSGTKDDLGLLTPLESEKFPVPVCDQDDDCKWQCQIANEKDPKAAPEKHEIKTLGEYVKLCVEPEIVARASQPAAPSTPGGGTK